MLGKEKQGEGVKEKNLQFEQTEKGSKKLRPLSQGCKAGGSESRPELRAPRGCSRICKEQSVAG